MSAQPIRIEGDWEIYLRFRSQFAQVLDPERYTLQWLDAMVTFGQFVVIGNEDACILCEIKHYPTGTKDFHGMLAAGDLETIVETLIPYAESYGKELGCVGGLIESREGWAKALKSYGWEPFQLTLRKAL